MRLGACPSRQTKRRLPLCLFVSGVLSAQTLSPALAVAERVSSVPQVIESSQTTIPHAAELRQKHLASAQQAQRASQFDEASRGYAIVNAISPRSETLFLFAKCSQRAEHFAEALVALRRVKSADLQPSAAADVSAMETDLRGVLADAEPSETQLLRAHLDAGKRGFQTQAFLLALESFAVAYAIKPLPRLLFNMAQAARRANQSQLALVLYRRLIIEEPNSPVRTESQGYVAELEQLLEPVPLYRRPQLWGIVGGGLAAAALSIGLGVGLTQRDPTTDGGNVRFQFPALRGKSQLGIQPQ